MAKSRQRPIVVPEFGQLLRRLRQRRQFSQEDVVRALRQRGLTFTQSTLAQYEAGTVSSPDVLVLYGLAEIYECPARDLVLMLGLSRDVRVDASHEPKSILKETLALEPREQMAVDVVRRLPPMSDRAFDWLLKTMDRSADAAAEIGDRQRAIPRQQAPGPDLRAMGEIMRDMGRLLSGEATPAQVDDLRQRIEAEKRHVQDYVAKHRAVVADIRSRLLLDGDEPADEKERSSVYTAISMVQRSVARAMNEFSSRTTQNGVIDDAATAREFPAFKLRMSEIRAAWNKAKELPDYSDDLTSETVIGVEASIAAIEGVVDVLEQRFRAIPTGEPSSNTEKKQAQPRKRAPRGRK